MSPIRKAVFRFFVMLTTALCILPLQAAGYYEEVKRVSMKVATKSPKQLEPVELAVTIGDMRTLNCPAAFDWGDGETETFVLRKGGGEQTLKFSHTYKIAGRFTANLRLTKSECSANVSVQVVVSPADPATVAAAKERDDEEASRREQEAKRVKEADERRAAEFAEAERVREAARAVAANEMRTRDSEIQVKIEKTRTGFDKVNPSINEAIDVLFLSDLAYPPVMTVSASCTIEIWSKPKPERASYYDGRPLPAEPSRLVARYHLNTLDETRAAINVEPDYILKTPGKYVLFVPGSSVAKETFDSDGAVSKYKDLQLTVGIFGHTPATDVQRSKAALLYLYKIGRCKGTRRAF